jgi:hypothetical protein
MNTTHTPAQQTIAAALAEAQRDTREQVLAIWQLQMDRIRDLLSRDWQDQVRHVFEERFSSLSETVGERAGAATEAAVLEARREIVDQLGDHLNASFHRMREYRSDRHWCDALLDATGALCRRCAFFSIRAGELCLQGVRGMDEPRAAPADLPLVDARAFARLAAGASARDAPRTAAELSGPLAAFFGEAPDRTAWLVPVSTLDRVAGVLYIEEPGTRGAIEAIVQVAGAALENRLATVEQARPSTVTRPASVAEPVEHIASEHAPEGVPAVSEPPAAGSAEHTAAPSPARPRMTALPDAFELRARRFARVAVARIVLHSAAQADEGRLRGDLYGQLRMEIEAARRSFRESFLSARPSMADYVHAELVERLARGQADRLGSDYPGAMA